LALVMFRLDVKPVLDRQLSQMSLARIIGTEIRPLHANTRGISPCQYWVTASVLCAREQHLGHFEEALREKSWPAAECIGDRLNVGLMLDWDRCADFQFVVSFGENRGINWNGGALDPHE
jgi:hypothetical protein